MSLLKELPTAESINWYSQIGALYALAKPELVNNTGLFSSNVESKLVIQHVENTRHITLDKCVLNVYEIDEIHFLVATVTESNGHSFDIVVALNEVMNNKEHYNPKDGAGQLGIEFHIWHPKTLKLISVTNFVCDDQFNKALNELVIYEWFNKFHHDKVVMHYNQSNKKHYNKEAVLSCVTVMAKNTPQMNEPLLISES